MPDTWDVLDACNGIEMAHNEHINLAYLEEDVQKYNKAKCMEVLDNIKNTLAQSVSNLWLLEPVNA